MGGHRQQMEDFQAELPQRNGTDVFAPGPEGHFLDGEKSSGRKDAEWGVLVGPER